MVDSEGGIVFVEVRTKANEDFSSVESSITSVKKTRLKRTARYFISTNNLENRSFRFDIIAIVLGNEGKPELRHYKNAFVL